MAAGESGMKCGSRRAFSSDFDGLSELELSNRPPVFGLLPTAAAATCIRHPHGRGPASLPLLARLPRGPRLPQQRGMRDDVPIPEHEDLPVRLHPCPPQDLEVDPTGPGPAPELRENIPGLRPVVVDDLAKLWRVHMEGKVVAAPEYCHVNFTLYFTDSFWSEPSLAKTFKGRKACYFNTGVMVIDVDTWRKERYTDKVEVWMAVQKQHKRIYHLGSLPPFLLVLAGNIKAVDHRWNQHGLGGDNFEGKCRSLHPGPISLLHWSGKGKPWLRLDSRKPCIVDHLWAPYDLYRSFTHFED
ncbi:hypothetical protein Fmac_013561 [Flemingia macrophylla]|uniref:Hexosyltransferase n=1 Tax=Flemingia macrophylla TaxID=520843 RepID=A0ABD1MTG6_9FABA